MVQSKPISYETALYQYLASILFNSAAVKIVPGPAATPTAAATTSHTQVQAQGQGPAPMSYYNALLHYLASILNNKVLTQTKTDVNSDVDSVVVSDDDSVVDREGREGNPVSTEIQPPRQYNNIVLTDEITGESLGFDYVEGEIVTKTLNKGIIPNPLVTQSSNLVFAN